MATFNDIRIFVGAVNQPSLGKWFTLPVSPEKIRQDLEAMSVIGSGTGNEEIMISDYEAPFHISEYESIAKINRVIESARRAIDNGVSDQVLRALISQGLVSLTDKIDEQVSDLHIIQADEEEDLASEVLALSGGVGNLSEDKLSTYFDFQKYGHDLILGGDYTELANGYYVSVI